MLKLEVIVTSVEDAIAAARGGAHRLEVVRALDEEGLTPSRDLVRAIAASVDLPLRVMVRARNTFDVSSPDELDRMCDDARAFAASGVEGIVCGFVRDAMLDAEAVAAVATAAPACRVTVHRALEATRDPCASIAALGRHASVDRVLATGGTAPWSERIGNIERLAAAAPGGVTLLVGGGVDAAAATRIARVPRFIEVHVGRAARQARRVDLPVDAEAVAAIVRACARPREA